MSTEFRTETGEWVCTRFCSKQGASVDFGSRALHKRWMTAALRSDVTLQGEDGSTEDLLVLATSLRATFGEFCGTVELGSGEMFDRLGFDDAE